MRKQIAVANWKMNLTLQQAEALVDDLMAIPHDLKENQAAIFGVPFPYLTSINNKLAGKKNVFHHWPPSSVLDIAALASCLRCC